VPPEDVEERSDELRIVTFRVADQMQVLTHETSCALRDRDTVPLRVAKDRHETRGAVAEDFGAVDRERAVDDPHTLADLAPAHPADEAIGCRALGTALDDHVRETLNRARVRIVGFHEALDGTLAPVVAEPELGRDAVLELERQMVLMRARHEM